MNKESEKNRFLWLRPRMVTGWGLILVAVVLSAWFLFGPGKSKSQIPNVLLISIDTCRADYLSCYGYPRKITPNIDAVAKDGFLFENVFTPVPLTLPAHCSMLTGTTPLHHQVHDNIGYKLSSANVSLAEIMRERGYKTGAIISSFVLDSQFGLEQGFDSYNDHFEDKIESGNYEERRGDEASRFAVRWLEEHKNDSFFLFLHYYDPHYRYEPPEPYASEFADNPYAGEVAYTDHCIGEVIDKLKGLGLYDSALIVITADHGEMLGEHGEAEHGYFIYQSAIKVPLIFKLPGRNKAGRINSIAGLTDIVPTICSLAGMKRPGDIQGKDLSGYFSKKKRPDQQRFIYCESILPTRQNANALLGIVTQGWKYIHTNRAELYNLSKDPGEKNNLLDKEPQRARLLREHLRLILEERPDERYSDSKLELDEQSRKRLESLGYVGSGRADDKLELDPNKADAKDFVKFHNLRAYNEMAMRLVEQGKLKEAGEAYKEFIRHYEAANIEHAMGTIHFNLAVILTRMGQQQQATEQFGKAIKEFRLEVQKDPKSALIWARLGDALATTGDFGAAAGAFSKALVLEPANMLYYDNLTKALEYGRDYDKAIQVLEKGVEFMSQQGQTKNVARLRKYLEYLQAKKTKVK